MARREYAGGAAPTTLNGSITDVSTSITVADGAGWPTGAIGPFFIAIDKGKASEEKILIQSRAANVLTVATAGRGADGTTAVAHADGADVTHIFTATDADEANAHVNATTAVHGVSGSVVGTSGAQTLTDKTISGSNNVIADVTQAGVTGLTTRLGIIEADITVAETDIVALEEFTVSGTLQTAPVASSDNSSYPSGVSIWGATTGNGWPTNGILVHYKYAASNRYLQKLVTASTGATEASMFFRSWGSAGWTEWVPYPDTSLYPKQVSSDQNGVGGFGPTWVATSTGLSQLGTTFVAPRSGRVFITVTGSIEVSVNGRRTYLSYEVRSGSTIGSGSVVVSPGSSRSVQCGEAVTTGGPNTVTASNRYMVDELTPGNTYNVRAMHYCSADNHGSVTFRRLTVEFV